MHERVLLWFGEWLVNRRAVSLPLPEGFKEAEFFRLGWVDSFGIVELIEDTERQFGFSFAQAELDDPRFGIVAGYVDIVAGAMKRSGKS